MQRRVRIIVSGRVQGVGFRASARDRAIALELTGWVRNLSDERVEILAQGEKFAVATLIDWCGNGPRWASVDEVAVIDERPIEEFTGFAVRRDE